MGAGRKARRVEWGERPNRQDRPERQAPHKVCLLLPLASGLSAHPCLLVWHFRLTSPSPSRPAMSPQLEHKIRNKDCPLFADASMEPKEVAHGRSAGEAADRSNGLTPGDRAPRASGVHECGMSD